MLNSPPMLKALSISNLAVVNRLQVEFEAGLNLLTGETGSGKSIIVDALGVLLGGRGSQDIIRSGEQKAFVEGCFQVSGHKDLFEIVERAGIETDGAELIIRRELSATGRSRAFINDQLTTIGFLRELRPFLVDIHGQGEQQTLLYPDSHIDLLDLFAGFEKECSQIRESYRRWQELELALAELRRDEADRLRSLDILEFQLREIERARLQVGEDARLEEEKRLLLNAERLTSLSAQCYDLLYESESAALAQLATVGRRLEELASLDGRFISYIESVHNAKYSLEDLAFFLRDYVDNINFSAERLKEIEERLVEIDRLKRKYGHTIEEIKTVASQMHERLEQLESFDTREQELMTTSTAARSTYWQLAETLSRKRRQAARKLETAVIAELQQLAMERIQFIISFISAAEDGPRAGERGLDTVEFLVSANVGEELRPLAKIASGGEISRLMLALKTITAPSEYPRTLVFDEIDVGIGGRVAESVGQRLKRLAATSQVLCVTHQAQIARFADVHYSVEKHIVGERTEVLVEKLDRAGRIEELARMIGGAEITELTRRHAHELLTERK
ncbi:MAG: DNA repair protein RecN [Acidobacteriota bacterium]